MLPYFQWFETTMIGDWVKNSSWAFAVIESVHLLALSVIGGAVLMVNLRLLGLGLKRQSIPDVTRDAWPWLVASLIVMLMTGFALFVSEATKCYYSTPFWVKMTSLALSMAFTFTIWKKVSLAEEGQMRPAMLKLVALVSLTLWFGVGAGGRWIGFSG